MELKRYVLLKNNKIIDTTTKVKDDVWGLSYYVIKNTDLAYTPDRTTLFQLLGKIVKTSDSLLDLVEIGDMVECEYHKETIAKDHKWIEKPIFNVVGISETHFNLPVFSLEKTHKYIVAIWKRQGDKFQRYEIERK